jgi:WhiB family redox-sensing transcriptional regulator
VRYPDFDGTQACADKEVNIFFAPDDNNYAFDNYAEARMTCLTCSFLDPCREYALSQPGLHGLWGGLSENQRDSIRRKEKLRSLAELCTSLI